MTTLTQTARIPGPSWDETIVPALRKRLESESRTLAKRMSAVSISSMDERDLADTTIRDTQPVYQQHQHIPFHQPSSQRKRSPEPVSYRSENVPLTNGSNSGPSRPQTTQSARSRTYSQPFASKRPPVPHANGRTSGPKESASKLPRQGKAPSPDSALPSSNAKPTRIPKPRSLTISVSSSSAPQQHRDLNGYNHAPPREAPDLYPVHESEPPSALVNETPPFSSPDTIRESASRSSSESEERPFEHWYRGEVSRNGGVGELRVGKRMEMLEIANYGHALKQRSAMAARGTLPDVGVGGPGEVHHNVDRTDWRRRRKRADSVSGILGNGRESLYLDDERARDIALVLDERPLTDLEDDNPDDNEDDDDTEVEDNTMRYSPYGEGDTPRLSPPTPTAPPVEPPRSGTPTSSKTRGVPSRIPTSSGARPSTESHRIPSPPLYRGASEPPPSLHSSSTPNTPTPRTRGQPSSVTAKARDKAPTATVNAKKAQSASSKTRAKMLAAKQAAQDEANRRSVAEYPTPQADGDMADAIPTWTQPVPKTGNWDEVVLPVVARKKGLNGHYLEADGSPQTKQRPESFVAPAPGTFGYDHSKYRPPRSESIPMDEFGHPGTPPQEADEEAEMTPTPVQHARRPESVRVPLRRDPPDAPPFSQYTPVSARVMEPAPQVKPSRSVFDEPDPKEEEEVAGGCCKSCVIM